MTPDEAKALIDSTIVTGASGSIGPAKLRAVLHSVVDAGSTSVAHTHVTSDVTGLDAALAGKAASSHGHAQSDITGLSAALAGKADASALASKADLASPNFTGAPTTPTAATATGTT